MLAIGLMSGTSLDGIDAALVRIVPRGDSYAIELLQFVTVPFDEEVIAALRQALPPSTVTAAHFTQLHRALGAALARAARVVSGALKIGYVASHGQTVYHDGTRHITLQLGDPFVLRESLNATVIYDFRSADCAAGGHGAPLVPYVDALLLADAAEDRVALNIGGIANLTALPRAADVHDLVAFDCGPGVMLIDAFVRQRTRGEMWMDEDGALAASGTPDTALLNAMLADPYFEMPPPKSTGRERFGEHFLMQHGKALGRLSLEDGAATLTALTARAIARAVRDVRMSESHIFCSGGGARNASLVRELQSLLPGALLDPTDVAGIPVDAKEAIAFAVLGYETLRERPANVPRVTGATRAVPLGAIAPHGLREVLAEVEAECLSS